MAPRRIFERGGMGDSGDRIDPRVIRARRVDRVLERAAEQGGVVSLAQLRGLEVTRSQVRAHVAARRWQRIHSQVVAVHAGPLPELGTMWAAVLEGGPRAYLDGASALIAEGLTGFTWEVIRVSVPPEARVRSAPGVWICRTSRHDPQVVTTAGVPRARPTWLLCTPRCGRGRTSRQRSC